MHAFTHSFAHSFINSPIHSLIYVFSHSLIDLFQSGEEISSICKFLSRKTFATKIKKIQDSMSRYTNKSSATRQNINLLWSLRILCVLIIDVLSFSLSLSIYIYIYIHKYQYLSLSLSPSLYIYIYMYICFYIYIYISFIYTHVCIHTHETWSIVIVTRSRLRIVLIDCLVILCLTLEFGMTYNHSMTKHTLISLACDQTTCAMKSNSCWLVKAASWGEKSWLVRFVKYSIRSSRLKRSLHLQALAMCYSKPVLPLPNEHNAAKKENFNRFARPHQPFSQPTNRNNQT